VAVGAGEVAVGAGEVAVVEVDLIHLNQAR
jgi:hypothetical protein